MPTIMSYGCSDKKSKWCNIAPMSIGAISGIAIYILCLLIPRRYITVSGIELLPITVYTWVMYIYINAYISRKKFYKSYSSVIAVNGLASLHLILITLHIYTSKGFYDIYNLKPIAELIASMYIVWYISNIRLAHHHWSVFMKIILTISTLSLLLSIGYSVITAKHIIPDQQLRTLSTGIGINRATSPFGGPNSVGALGAVILPILLGTKSRLRSLATIICIVAIVFSGSKTGLIAMIVGIIAYIGFNKRLRINIRTIILSIFIVVIIGYAIKSGMRISIIINPMMALQADGSGRVDVWLTTVNIIKPWIGWGKDYLIYNHILGGPFSAHNLWLQMILDYGVLFGGVLNVGFIYWLLRIIRGALKKRTDKVACGVAASTVAFLITTMSDYLLYDFKVIIALSIIIALYTNYVKIASFQ